MKDDAIIRLRVVLRGAVQGVGFRPFVYRLATDLGLKGWVSNTAQGLLIEVEGLRKAVVEFLLRLEKEKPSLAFIQGMESSFLDPVGYKNFDIRESVPGEKRALILPDIAICSECRREIMDPANRRYHYPFTNCTHCGPRYSIIESLPYDRANTTMRKFSLCPACRKEYEDPADRRFHAQPNACPDCGPRLAFWNEKGQVCCAPGKEITQAADAIRCGMIVAVKGLGGFHLMADARNTEAVDRLRQRKHREEKPFALMYPSLDMIKTDCEVSALEERLLLSPESPITLLRKKGSCQIASSVAPANPNLGVMLPYSPLHFLLVQKLNSPVVATSGNLSEEPMVIDEHEALAVLGGIADSFLVHDRPIARQVDDSIVRIMAGRELILRRARGYAPLPITIKDPGPVILGVGPQMKNTIAISSRNDVFVSQHIGDLENEKSLHVFERTISDLKKMYELKPQAVACDPHPGYLSTRFANNSGLPVVEVQHHYAHILSCMAENEITAPALGVSWDGTGYGLDGTIWGGEFLLVDDKGFTRAAYFEPFPLPGGEAAVREPRRTALGLLYKFFGEEIFLRKDLIPLLEFSPQELNNLKIMLQKNISCPVTSSVGRLFDAVAALLGLRQKVRFEGQAAMDLEFSVNADCQETYEFSFPEISGVIKMGTIIDGLLADLRQGVSAAIISAKFHNTLVEIIVAVAKKFGQSQVALSGGCFQNKYLTERAIRRLQEEGFKVYCHQRIPPNDGGISLGQVVAARKQTVL